MLSFTRATRAQSHNPKSSFCTFIRPSSWEFTLVTDLHRMSPKEKSGKICFSCQLSTYMMVVMMVAGVMACMVFLCVLGCVLLFGMRRVVRRMVLLMVMLFLEIDLMMLARAVAHVNVMR
jgi:hypothetical protein